MQTTIITCYNEFAKLQDNWNAVYIADVEAQFFLSWDYLAQVFARHKDNWCVVAVGPASTPANYYAFMPLRLRKRYSKSRDRQVTEVHMAGSLSWADYTGFICRPDYEQAIARLGVAVRDIHWQRLYLKNIRASEARLSLFMSHFEAPDFRCKYRTRTSATDGINLLISPRADLVDSFDAYLSSKLSSNTRQKIRRILRKVESTEQLEIIESATAHHGRDIDAVIALWKLRWSERKGDNVESLARQYGEILRQSSAAGNLYMPMLWHAGKPVAGVASFVDWQKKTLLFFVAGRDENFAVVPAGLALHAHSIRWAIENGLQTYDFLRGDEDYKYSFGATDQHIKYIVVDRHSKTMSEQRRGSDDSDAANTRRQAVMPDSRSFYVDGEWTTPNSKEVISVINPATEQSIASITLANSHDVDRAVAAARAAFYGYAQTTIDERKQLLQTLDEIYKNGQQELGELISQEMGAPIDMATSSQVSAGRRHIRTTLRALRHFKWQRSSRSGGTRIVHEPIGVCALITPWNWPMNQIMAKVIPALAAGCCVVLKPSERAPLSAMLFADMIDAAGFPQGVFNLINGDGAGAGDMLSKHAQIDMISLTGSTHAGKAVSVAAAGTLKRVTLELGGKAPNIIFADADLQSAVKRGVRSCFYNSGQSCNLPSRMLVEHSRYDEALALAEKVAASVRVGDPAEQGSHIGPLANAIQFDRVQTLIAVGIEEGANLLVGGLGKPPGFERGYFVRPTIFTDVHPNMRIAREEIFGPVLCIMPFKDEEEAIALANDTVYGLASYVHTKDRKRAQRVAGRIRAGMVQVNGASHSSDAPFGGYKQSGNGREFGEYGLREFLEVKSISGVWATSNKERYV